MTTLYQYMTTVNPTSRKTIKEKNDNIFLFLAVIVIIRAFLTEILAVNNPFNHRT